MNIQALNYDILKRILNSILPMLRQWIEEQALQMGENLNNNIRNPAAQIRTVVWKYTSAFAAFDFYANSANLWRHYEFLSRCEGEPLS